MEKKKTKKKAISGNPGSSYEITPHLWRVMKAEIGKEIEKISGTRTPRAMIIIRDTIPGNHGETIPRLIFEITLEGRDAVEGNLMDIIYRKGDVE